ncbi:MAG: transcriptional regulator, family [Herbinix sp.]|jgi:flagellar biosynthesis component FlhA|nr:transcriptional regulator, family [Herbinix sp.]
MGLKGFDDRMAKARKEKGFTQEELAIRLGVTPQAVSKWERGVGYPDLELLCYICEVLECSTDYMLHRDASKVRLTESNDEQQKKQLLQNLLAEPLVVEVGDGFVELLVEEYKNHFPSIQVLREKMAIQYGILLPLLRVRDNEELGGFEYRIQAYDQVLFSETVTKVIESSFQDICVRLEKVILENFSKIINRQIIKTLVENVSDKYSAVVQGVIPEKVSLSLLQKVLSGLVERKISIRNLIKIIELLEDESMFTKDVEQLIEVIIKRL